MKEAKIIILVTLGILATLMIIMVGFLRMSLNESKTALEKNGIQIKQLTQERDDLRSQLTVQKAIGRMAVDLLTYATKAEVEERSDFLKDLISGEISTLVTEQGRVEIILEDNYFRYTPSEKGYSASWSGKPPWAVYNKRPR